MHAKRPRYCSSELKCMVREVKRTDQGTKGQWRCLKACCLIDQCCRLLQLFPPILCWHSSSEFRLCNLRPSLSLYWFFALSSSLFYRSYMQKNESKDRKEVPTYFRFLFSFSFFFFFLFYCLPSRSHSNARMKEKNSLVLCFFSLLMPASLMFFLVFVFSFFPTLSSSPR